MDRQLINYLRGGLARGGGMAKQVLVNHLGESMSFAPTRVDRAKIYGARKRIAVDVEGRNCTRASLTADGGQLLVSGMTAQAYFTNEGC